jgi:hypothetical protein
MTSAIIARPARISPTPRIRQDRQIYGPLRLETKPHVLLATPGCARTPLQCGGEICILVFCRWLVANDDDEASSYSRERDGVMRA